MKVAVAYCYPMVDIRRYYQLAKRFAESYARFPAGCPHELHVYANGMVPTRVDRSALAGIDCQLHSRSNVGWDIGAFQQAADDIACDLLVCLGAPVQCHRAGWLARMAESYIENGPGLFGCTCYGGPITHVRTTAFWTAPDLLRSYPERISSYKGSRYMFEHGHRSFTQHVFGLGFNCFMVTWENVYPFPDWHNHAPGPDQILVWDQHVHG